MISPHCLLFTGHRIDSPGREKPRLPAAVEHRARAMIQQAVEEDVDNAAPLPICGIASAASGGDILFHEVCADMGIPTTIYLALPRTRFAAASVADAGADWLTRYYALLERRPVKQLPGSSEHEHPDLNVWQRTNLWMLETAAESRHAGFTLFALWDGKAGDGRGGTEDMIHRARGLRARIVMLDSNELKGNGKR